MLPGSWQYKDTMDEVSKGSSHIRDVRAGMALMAITLAYMTAEAVIAIWTGMRDRSVSLESFGVDSLIEWWLAAVLLWRLGVEARGSKPERIEQVERRANWWAGVAYFALALYIIVDSGLALWTGSRPSPSFIGLGLAVAAVFVMPVLAYGQRKIGDAIGSSALKAEAGCTAICGYMAAILLIGLILTRYLGWWWADPVAALGLLYWIISEGRESFEKAAGRETCCCGRDG